MNEDKKYIVKKRGDGKCPHILANAENESEILALCSCGKTGKEDYTCDGSHASGCDCDYECGNGKCC